MKKLIFILLTVGLFSCKGCFTTYESQKAGVNKVCPTCTFVHSERDFYAVDTSKQPNIVYIVYFKPGGLYHTASEVNYLVRVN
jgi:hypothetical protein